MVECGVFVGCQCSHICVLPCTLCPPFCCCLYILYVIASLYICNCLCLCVYPLHVVCTYCMKNFLCLCNCLCLCTCFCAIIPSTTLHVFVCTPSQMVTLCLFWCPVNTRTLDDCRFFFPLGTSVGLADDRILSILWPAAVHALVRSLSRPCFRRTFLHVLL